MLWLYCWPKFFFASHNGPVNNVEGNLSPKHKHSFRRLNTVLGGRNKSSKNIFISLDLCNSVNNTMLLLSIFFPNPMQCNRTVYSTKTSGYMMFVQCLSCTFHWFGCIVSSYDLATCLVFQYGLKTSRRLDRCYKFSPSKTSSRPLQDVFAKRLLQDVFKISWKHVLKTSWKIK